MTDFRVDDLHRATLIDSDGDKVGSVGQVYLDDATGQPDWVTVSTGLFGTNESFVPLRGASLEGDLLRVPYTKADIKDAPNFDAEHHLDVEEENRLFEHYGFDGVAGVAGQGTDGDRYADVDRDAAVDRTVDVDRDRNRGVDVDLDRDRADVNRADVNRGVGSDGETVVRREERLNVDKSSEVAGRARLRKHVVNDTETVEVPVKREVLTVDRETIAGGDARDVGTIGDDDSVEDITLREERVNVSKDTVGVEKVRVGKETVTDTETVSENVKKERVEVDGEDDLRRR